MNRQDEALARAQASMDEALRLCVHLPTDKRVEVHIASAQMWTNIGLFSRPESTPVDDPTRTLMEDVAEVLRLSSGSERPSGAVISDMLRSALSKAEASLGDVS